MRLKALLSVSVVVVVFLVGAPMALASPNLVSNGSFETGDFSGWTEGGNFQATSVTFGGFYEYSGAQDGTWYAVMVPPGSDGTLSQTFATTAGAHYEFDFWFASVGDDPSDFSAYWDGTQLLSLTDPNTSPAWTLFTYDVTGTGSDTIQFAFRDDPAYMALDNISVTQISGTTPEPGSFLLLGSGLLAALGTLRRKLR
jgi:hypothetical protein